VAVETANWHNSKLLEAGGLARISMILDILMERWQELQGVFWLAAVEQSRLQLEVK